MASLTPQDTTLNQLLTSYTIGYRAPGCVGQSVVPIVFTPHEFGSYLIYDKSFLRTVSTARAYGEMGKATNFSTSQGSFRCFNYQIARTIPYEIIDNSDPVDILRRASLQCVDVIQLEAEKRIYNLFSTGVGSSLTVSGGSAFTNNSASFVVSAAAVARQAIVQITGISPSHAIVPRKTFDILRQHPDVTVHKIGNTAEERLAGVLGVDTVLVPDAVKDGGQEGQTTVAGSYSAVWSTGIFFCYVQPNPSPISPSFATQFVWNGPRVSPGGPVSQMRVQQGEDIEQLMHRVWATYYVAELITAPELGFRIDTGI